MDTISKMNAGIMGVPAAGDIDSIAGRQGRNASVLVADGDQHIRKQLSGILRKLGCDAAVSGNGEDALNQFLLGSFDIVFTALKNPGMDGLTLSLHIKAASLNTPVVLILDEYLLENFMNRIKKEISGIKYLINP